MGMDDVEIAEYMSAMELKQYRQMRFEAWKIMWNTSVHLKKPLKIDDICPDRFETSEDLDIANMSEEEWRKYLS